mmetsp:Transcript_9600/g.26530  ORF Transcript_9600/g.26530 Transcript_9600/m.26530 type:complete len:307 (-) Transcript_9600:1141-2061(-)
MASSSILLFAFACLSLIVDPAESGVPEFLLQSFRRRVSQRERQQAKTTHSNSTTTANAAATTTTTATQDNHANMGQAIRMISYDYAGNQKNAVTALRLMGGSEPGEGSNNLNWFRLDDGVMGGRSSTEHKTVTDDDTSGTKSATTTTTLQFAGTINTDGGGFCSIRANLPTNCFSTSKAEDYAIKLCYKGDGKTYKILLSDGSRGGPMSSSPSWQVDLPTQTNGGWHEQTFQLSQFVPSFAGSRRGTDDYMKHQLHPHDMREIGFMLSLRRADGSPNPEETFGKEIFPFSLDIKSIEIIQDQEEKT